jgi:hypothetical protein
LPFTPRTVTVTSLPIITVSPTRLVSMSIYSSSLIFGRPDLESRKNPLEKSTDSRRRDK